MFVYNYLIDIPSVGEDHKRAVEQNSLNTFGTFYNWCMSKVTKHYAIKWDGDFVPIRNNLIE
jgi:hypothetical protein